MLWSGKIDYLYLLKGKVTQNKGWIRKQQFDPQNKIVLLQVEYHQEIKS